MSIPKTIQLVAKLPNPLLGNCKIVDGNDGGSGGRPFLISRLKPIVIEPPRQTGQNHIVLLDSDESSDYELTISSADDVPRKRARLTNLSNEEKIMRRKLKNRVSAQTARDRKKQKMTELEEMIMALQQQNKILEAENYSLKSRTEALTKENRDLKQQLSGTFLISKESPNSAIIVETPRPQVIRVQKKRKLEPAPEPNGVLCKGRSVLMRQECASPPKPSDATSSALQGKKVINITSAPNSEVRANDKYNEESQIISWMTSSVQPCGSAALTRLPPQQQELHRLMAIQLIMGVYLFMNLTALGILSSLICLEGCKALEITQSPVVEAVKLQRKAKSLRRWERKPSTLRKWWGRHQKNWNPSANS